jgi:hypothetical protein
MGTRYQRDGADDRCEADRVGGRLTTAYKLNRVLQIGNQTDGQRRYAKRMLPGRRVRTWIRVRSRICCEAMPICHLASPLLWRKL